MEVVEPNRLLRLRAEMKLPGRAWLEFRVKTRDTQTATLSQIAFFAPRGLWGVVYWYSIYPIHGLIFSGLLRRIAEEAVRIQEASEKKPEG